MTTIDKIIDPKMKAWWDEELTVHDCQTIKTVFKLLHNKGMIIKGNKYLLSYNATTVMEYFKTASEEASNVEFNSHYDTS